MEIKRKRGFYEKYIKRLLDIICALLAIIVFGWLYIIVAILVRIKMGSPVVFKQPRPGMIDPKTGNRIKVNRKNEDALDNEAIAFYKPFPSKKIGVAGLLRFIAENITSADVIMIAAATLIVTLIGFLTPKLNELLFSDVIASGSMRALTAIAIFIICVSLSALLLTTVKEMIVSRLTTRVGVSVDAAAMMRILSLPADFFKNYGSGELANRERYINLLVERLLQVIFTTGLTSLFSLAYISQIFTYAPALVAPAMFVVITTLLIGEIATHVYCHKRRIQQSHLADGREAPLPVAHIPLNGDELPVRMELVTEKGSYSVDAIPIRCEKTTALLTEYGLTIPEEYPER